MKPLKALINKDNLKKFHNANTKVGLKDGDVVLTKNDLFLIYFSKEIIQKKFPLLIQVYGYNMNIKDGLFVKPTSRCKEKNDYRFSYNFIECVNYNNDLEREGKEMNNIVKIYRKAIDINRNEWDEIYLDYINFVNKNK